MNDTPTIYGAEGTKTIRKRVRLGSGAERRWYSGDQTSHYQGTDGSPFYYVICAVAVKRAWPVDSWRHARARQIGQRFW